MSVYEEFTSLIGETPLVKLQRMFQNAGFDVYAKLEMLNPGGSIKDRPARAMLKAAIEDGRVRPGSVVVESSSGNLAIGLAQLCNRIGCTFICVVDPRTTSANMRILRAYGAKIDVVLKPDQVTGEYVPARLNRVRHWLRKLPGAYWPNQYANPHNALAHEQTTMKEIAADLPDLDYLFCGVSTCGTIRGCLDYIRSNGLGTKVIAVDAVGSVIFGGEKGDSPRLLPGLGAGIEPSLRPEEGITDVVRVNDRESIIGCRNLARQESILAGGSSGGVIAAALKYQDQIKPGALCAVILPDRGERYLDTIFDDSWVAHSFGAPFAASLQVKGRPRV